LVQFLFQCFGIGVEEFSVVEIVVVVVLNFCFIIVVVVVGVFIVGVCR